MVTKLFCFFSGQHILQQFHQQTFAHIFNKLFKINCDDIFFFKHPAPETPPPPPTRYLMPMVRSLFTTNTCGDIRDYFEPML